MSEDTKQMLIRTVAPQAWAMLVIILVEWGVNLDWLTSRPQTLVVVQFLFGVLLYGIALGLGKYYPAVEKLILLSSKRPENYTKE